MPLRIPSLATVVLALWSVGVGVAPAPPQKKAEPSGLPDEAREALKKKWPDWQMAALAPALASCQADGKAPAALITADFDTDGHADFAAAIQTKQGVKLAVLTWRPWGFDLYDVDSLGDSGAAAALVVAARGKKFVNPRTQLDDYFPGDTLTSRTCEKGATAYFWTGVGFNRVVIASIAPATSERP